MIKPDPNFLAEIDRIIASHELKVHIPEPDLSDSNATNIAYPLIEPEDRSHLPLEFPEDIAKAEPASQARYAHTASELRKVHGLNFGWAEQWNKNEPAGMAILEDLTWLKLYRLAIWQMLEASRRNDEEEAVAWLEISKSFLTVFSFAPHLMRCIMANCAWFTLYDASMKVYSESSSSRVRRACRDGLSLSPSIDLEKVVAGEACIIRELIAKPQEPLPWEEPDLPENYESQNLYKISHLAQIVTQLRSVEPLPSKAEVLEALAKDLLNQRHPDLDIDFFDMVHWVSRVVHGLFRFPDVMSGILNHIEARTVPPRTRSYRIQEHEGGYVIKLSSRIRRNYQITVIDQRITEISGDQLSFTGRIRKRRSGS